MDRLRPRQRQRPAFSGFTNVEIEKMEKLLMESREPLQSKEFCQKIARSFSSSSARAGKPIVKWTEVQSWFLARQQESASKVPSMTDTSKNESRIPNACPLKNGLQSSQILKDVLHRKVLSAFANFSPSLGVISQMGEKIPDLSKLEFEAKSSKDGAWYDVDMFLTHRCLSSGESEVHVRFIGFGAEEDEWVNVKKGVRVRSIPFEHSECNKVIVGDLVLCLQERRDQSIYYDAHVVEIERKTHDIRGCRCIFLIRYDHDSSEASILPHCLLVLINRVASARKLPLKLSILTYLLFFLLLGESSFEETMLYSRPINQIVCRILPITQFCIFIWVGKVDLLWFSEQEENYKYVNLQPLPSWNHWEVISKMYCLYIWYSLSSVSEL
ncbi:hypothetical protein REPUB_Repub03eG0033100 [Reevesia pubescens]